MKEFTKSTLSLGCALSLLGAKQAFNAIVGNQIHEADMFGTVTHSAVSQLDESMQRIHRSAEGMESRAVDMVYSFFNVSHWPTPKSWNLRNSAPRSQASNYSKTDQPSVTDTEA